MPFSSIAGSSGGGGTTDFGNKTGPSDGNEQYNDGVATVSGYFTTDASGGTLGDGHGFLTSPNVGDTQAMRLLVYADDGTGVHPSTTLIGVTDELVLTGGGVDTFKTFTGWTHFGGAPVLAANTKYWLGAWWGTQTGAGGTKINFSASDNAPSLIHGAGGVTYSSVANPVVGAWGAGGTLRADKLYYDITASGGSGGASMRCIRRRGYS